MVTPNGPCQREGLGARGACVVGLALVITDAGRDNSGGNVELQTTREEAGSVVGACQQLGERRVPSVVSLSKPVGGRDDVAVVVDFDTLYRTQRGRVLATVRNVIGASDEVEDVVQLVFIEVHRCLPRFEGRSKLSTWVYRIAVNVALQHLRKRKRKRWLTLGLTGEELKRRAASVDQVARIEDRQILEEVYVSADKL
ncbi:MAG: hypothetical protein CSA66_08135, partial [Proteobacteria bacterium]